MEKKRYFIYAYDEMYNGLYGMYDYRFDYCSFDSQNRMVMKCLIM